jgi:hypothetical protein
MRTDLILTILFLSTCLGAAQERANSAAQGTGQSSDATIKATTDKRPPKRVVADLSGFELDSTKSKSQAGLQMGAGSRGASVPPALYAPSLGKAYSLRPTFYWGTSPGAQKFTVRIYDSDEDEVYEQEVAGNLHSLTYPADAPSLKAGATYSWTVQAMATQLVEPPDPVRITLVAGSERQLIEQALQGSNGNTLTERRKRAQLFVDHRLWYDAISEYSQLIADNRDNLDLYQERAQVYAQLPVTQQLANQDLDQAGRASGRN